MSPKICGNRSRLTFALLAGIALIAFSPALAGASPGGSISGTYSVESPVAPVFCHGSTSLYGPVTGERNYAAGTGIHDTYQFNGLEEGDYQVGFDFHCMGELDWGLHYDSSTSFHSPVHVTEGSARTGINSIADGGASISGMVKDSSGKPLDGICVDTFDDQGNLGDFGHTGPDGSYGIDQFVPGDYRLKFSDCLNPESSVVPEFYDDKSDLAGAAPVSLTSGQEVTGIDAELDVAEPDTTVPETTVPKAANLRIRAKGPVGVRAGKKVTFRIRILNTGDAHARGVALKVRGKGIRFGTTVGRISAGRARTVKVKLKPKRKGKSKLTFKVTSQNAGSKTFKRGVIVKK